MANEYTSIATAGGWSTNTVQPAWDLVFRTALNAKPACRQFVDVRPEKPTAKGSSVSLQITNYFSEASVTAAKTPLNEELDVDSVKLPATSLVTLTPAEYGFVVSRTKKLAGRSMVPVDPVVAATVADHCDKVIDELLQDQMVLGTQVYYASTATSTVTVTAAMTLTSDKVRKAKTKLDANQAQARDGQFYFGLVHPNVVYDLRAETGSGGWRVPNEYGSDQTRLFRGEFGEWEGVRWLQNARLRNATDGAAAARVYRSFILGKEALAEAVVDEPGVVIGPDLDKLRRFRHVGWAADLAFKIFRNEALVRLESASAA